MSNEDSGGSRRAEATARTYANATGARTATQLDELAWQAAVTPSLSSPIALAMLADALVEAEEIVLESAALPGAAAELDAALAWTRAVTIPLETQLSAVLDGKAPSMTLSSKEICDLARSEGIAVTRIRPDFERSRTLRVVGAAQGARRSGARAFLREALQRRLPPGVYVDIEIVEER